ncbi:unnamed protein product, partial [Owenia fusiformis]
VSYGYLKKNISLVRLFFPEFSMTYNMKKVVEEFADHTTAHGWGNISQRSSTLGKTVWIIFTLGCTCLAIASIIGTISKYFEYETKDIVELRDEPLEFPSVTVCPLNPIAHTHQLMYRQNIYYEIVDYHNLTNNILPTERKTPQHNTLYKDYINQLVSYQGYYENAMQILVYSHNKDDFITSCTYMENMCNRSDITTSLHHEHYNCFTYSTSRSLPDFAKTTVGPNSGLSMILYLDVSKLSMTLYDPNYPTSGSNGARVVIHERGSLPDPEKDGSDIEPGHSVNAALSVNRRELMKKPWGNCVDYSALDAGGFVHTMNSCIKRCQQKRVYEECGCVKASLPLEPDLENAQFCGKLDVKEWLKNEPNITILNEDLNRLECQKSAWRPCKTCAKNCTYHTYDVSLSQSEWPTDGAVKSFYERWIMQQPNYENSTLYHRFHREMKDLKDIYSVTETTKSAIKNNFVRLNVYFKESETKVTTKAQAFDLANLIAETGGFLGFYVGISVISIAEVMILLYNLLNFLRNKLIQQKYNNTNNAGVNIKQNGK